MKKEFESVKEKHRTMGYAKIPIDTPDKFLKKNEGVKKPEHKPDKEEKQKNEHSKSAPVPKRDERGEIKHNSDDFTKKNIENAKSATTKKIKPRRVDSEKGNVMNLEKSGLQPEYVNGSNFGKVPKFIEKRKNKLNEEKKNKGESKNQNNTNYQSDVQNQNEWQNQEVGNGNVNCRYISQEERLELLKVIIWNLFFILVYFIKL